MNRKHLETLAKIAFTKACPELEAKAVCGCKAAQSARKAWVNGWVTETAKHG